MSKRPFRPKGRLRFGGKRHLSTTQSFARKSPRPSIIALAFAGHTYVSGVTEGVRLKTCPSFPFFNAGNCRPRRRIPKGEDLAAVITLNSEICMRWMPLCEKPLMSGLKPLWEKSVAQKGCGELTIAG